MDAVRVVDEYTFLETVKRTGSVLPTLRDDLFLLEKEVAFFGGDKAAAMQKLGFMTIIHIAHDPSQETNPY